MYKKNNFYLIFVFTFLVTLTAVSFAHAGTLQFEGVPVDITTAAGEDLVVVPGTGGNTQIGDISGTNSNATSNDDLYITGVVESNGAIYADGGIVSGSNITPESDSAYTLGTSSKAWSSLYTDTVATVSSTDLALSPASGSGVSGTVTRSAATGNETAYNLAATINKATSGNYTGLKLNVTETSAPGSADKLMDLQVGGTSKFGVDNSGNVTTTGNVGIGE
ncbi:MAG: hypothetical protein ABH844_00005, partial [Candidatus Omnitrophota bacterium]